MIRLFRKNFLRRFPILEDGDIHQSYPFMLGGLLLVACLMLIGAPGEAQQPDDDDSESSLELVGATGFDLGPSNRSTEIELRGNHVFLGSSSRDDLGLSVLKVADVEDPMAPVPVANFNLPGPIMDVKVNLDEKRCGYGRDIEGRDDPACNTLVATSQRPPFLSPTPNDAMGVWIFDIRDPANVKPWGWDAAKGFEDQIGFIQYHAVNGFLTGTHNGFLFGDYVFAAGIGAASFEIWDIRPLFQNPPRPPVKAAFYLHQTDPRPVKALRESPFTHDLFVQRAPDGRVFAYVAGPQLYVVDVTDVVDSETTRGDISDHLVAYNNYIDADGTEQGTMTVAGYTNGASGHYVEPTDDGQFAYIGDEIECGRPAIIHIFDSSDLPAPGDAPKQLEEVGVLDWPTPRNAVSECLPPDVDDPKNDKAMDRTAAWTGHNFRIYGDILTHSGAYKLGASVWDISDRKQPALLARYREIDGTLCDGRQPDIGLFGESERCGSLWQVVSGGDPEAVLDGEQFLYGADLVLGLRVWRLQADDLDSEGGSRISEFDELNRKEVDRHEENGGQAERKTWRHTNFE